MQFTTSSSGIKKVYEASYTGRYWVYPFKTGGVQLLSNAVPYVSGNYGLIYPALNPDNPLYIVSLIAYTHSAAVEFFIDLAKGESGQEQIIAQAYTLSEVITRAVEIPFVTPILLPVSSRISARVADSSGGGNIRVRLRFLV